MPKLAKGNLCTGCLACKDACPKHAISISLNNGLVYPYVDKVLCINCHNCEKSCPIVTPQRTNNVNNMRVYGGWAKDDNTRVNGASGGAFAGLAKSFMSAHYGNVSVFGASLVDNDVRHERITTLDEIPLLMNSKYIQSSTDGIYKKVCSDLLNGLWVLFSGTPCQVAALYAYLGKERDNDRLMTIEVVCHGVPGKEALDIHLQYFHSTKIYSFRNKEVMQGQIVTQCASQRTTIERDGRPYRIEKKDDVFYKIFSGWILDRKSCSDCQYSNLSRVADITLADFWGGARDIHEYDKGVNVIVANNQKSDVFLRNAADVELYGSTLGKAIGGNPRFYDGYKYIIYHPVVMWPSFFRKVLPKKIWLHIIMNDMPWKLIWAFFKILTILHIKIMNKRVRKQYSGILDEWPAGGPRY